MDNGFVQHPGKLISLNFSGTHLIWFTRYLTLLNDGYAPFFYESTLSQVYRKQWHVLLSIWNIVAF